MSGNSATVRNVPRFPTVRNMHPADIPLVAIIAAGEATAPHWPITEYHRMLQVIAENPKRRGAWVLLTASANLSVATSDPAEKPADPADEPSEQLEGFAMASHVAGICELEAVVIRSASRGRGFGAHLIQTIAAWGRTLQATRLELEVRASNTSALRLYQRLGFTHDGTRPGYYRNPDEDAALMSLNLSIEDSGI